MNSINIKIPANESQQTEIQLNYLFKANQTDCGDFQYLQSLRSGVLKVLSGGNPEQHTIAINYHDSLAKYCEQFRSLMPNEIDAILSPPSRYPEHAEPYRTIAKQVIPTAIDLTPAFSRANDAPSSGTAGTLLEDIIASLTYTPCGIEHSLKSILVIDDIFSYGRTTYSLLVHLRNAGMSNSCKVTVACPLWIPT